MEHHELEAIRTEVADLRTKVNKVVTLLVGAAGAADELFTADLQDDG